MTITKENDSRNAEAIAYVRGRFFPPLPHAYGPWMIALRTALEEGTEPSQNVDIPDDVVSSGMLPRDAFEEDGQLRIRLFDALSALRVTHWLDD